MDQWLFAPTHSLSQLITSFFASESLGIRRTLLFSFSFIYLALVKLYLTNSYQHSSCQYTILIHLYSSVQYVKELLPITWNRR